MSQRNVRQFKFAQDCLSKAILQYSNISDITGRKYATSPPKEAPPAGPIVEQRRLSNVSSAQFTAQSPFALPGVTKERPMSHHDPGPLALMSSSGTVKPSNWVFQQEKLNGKRQTFDSVKDSELEDRKYTLEEERKTEGLEVLQEHCQDRRWRITICKINIMPRKNLRLVEDRQEVKRPLAKDLGPPKKLKTEVLPHIQKESLSWPYSTDSATLLVSSRSLNKSSSYPRLQEAPRSTCCNFKLNEELSRQQAFKPCIMPESAVAPSTTPIYMNSRKRSIMNFRRPDNDEELKSKYPINTVRPDIPPLAATMQLLQPVLQLQKARDSQVELSEEAHESSVGGWVAWPGASTTDSRD